MHTHSHTYIYVSDIGISFIEYRMYILNVHNLRDVILEEKGLMKRGIKNMPEPSSDYILIKYQTQC